MKKIKLIMPLAAIAATSAVVAPLMTITSCSNAAEWNVFDFGKDGFEYKGGISKITKPSTMFAATTDYMSAVKQEPKIFVQDYANYLYEMQKDEAEKQGYEIKDFKVQITTPVFGSTKAAYPGEGEYTYPTISFKIKHDLTKLVSLAQETITIETKTSGELSYTNVPFFAYPEEKTLLKNDSETYVWSVGVRKLLTKYPFVFQYMDTNFAISGTHDETITTTYAEYEGYKDVRSSHQNYYVDQVADLSKFASNLQVMAMMMDFNSRYLSAVKISPEIEATEETNKSNSLQLEVLTDATNNKVKIHGLELSKPIDASETLPTYTIGKNYVLPTTIRDKTTGKDVGAGIYLHINAGAKVSIDTTDRQTITIESDTSASSGKQVELVADEGVDVPTKITGDNFQVHFPHTLEVVEGTTEMFVSIPTSGICVVKGEIVEPTTKEIKFSAQQFVKLEEGSLPTFTPFTYKNGVANDLYANDTNKTLEIEATVSLVNPDKGKEPVTLTKLPIYFLIVPSKSSTTEFNIEMTVECAKKYLEQIEYAKATTSLKDRETVMAGDKWTFTLTNLPLYDAKNDLTYTIDMTKYSVTLI